MISESRVGVRSTGTTRSVGRGGSKQTHHFFAGQTIIGGCVGSTTPSITTERVSKEKEMGCLGYDRKVKD